MKTLDELRSQIDTTKLLRNTCGMIFCGFEPELDLLINELKQRFDFPFFGCTGTGLLSTGGYSQSSICAWRDAKF